MTDHPQEELFQKYKIALVYSKNEKYYKFPGGGIHRDEAISVNSAYKSEDFFNEIMIKRETKVLQMIREGAIL